MLTGNTVTIHEALIWGLNKVSFHASMLDKKSIIVKLDVCASQMCHSIFRKRLARYLKRNLKMAGLSKHTIFEFG